MNPNSLDQELQDGQNPNPTNENLGTEEKETPNPIEEAEPTIDYQKKFSESAKEAQRLYEENKAKDAEIARLSELGRSPEVIPTDKITESLYPGFEELDKDAQDNLMNFAGVGLLNT